jgi:uncharacterized protein YdhG (YjbR/CyaY superfamily)
VTAAPKTVDEYIASSPKTMQPGLERLRASIRSAAPNAEEGISYGVPTFKYHGMLVSFGAAKNHLAFYGASAAILTGHEEELAEYDTAGTKGTIRFSPDESIPVELIKRLVKQRVAENEENDRRRQNKKIDTRKH